MDVLNWNTDKHYLRKLSAMGLPTIPTNWPEPERSLSKHQIYTRSPVFGEFVVKPAVSSGVRDIGHYTTVDTRQRQAVTRQVQGLLGEERSVIIQRYVEEIDPHGEISLVFFNGLVSHAVEKRSALHPISATDPSVHEAVVTVEAADPLAWKWGEEIRCVLHGYVRSRLGHDERSLFNRVDLVLGGKDSFLITEVSFVGVDLYLGSTSGTLGSFADAISAHAHWWCTLLPWG